MGLDLIAWKKLNWQTFLRTSRLASGLFVFEWWNYNSVRILFFHIKYSRSVTFYSSSCIELHVTDLSAVFLTGWTQRYFKRAVLSLLFQLVLRIRQWQTRVTVVRLSWHRHVRTQPPSPSFLRHNCSTSCSCYMSINDIICYTGSHVNLMVPVGGAFFGQNGYYPTKNTRFHRQWHVSSQTRVLPGPCMRRHKLQWERRRDESVFAFVKHNFSALPISSFDAISLAILDCWQIDLQAGQHWRSNRSNWSGFKDRRLISVFCRVWDVGKLFF